MRTTTTQLQDLLSNLREILAVLPGPLNKLFAKQLRDALLDYRDLLSENAELRWRVERARINRQPIIDLVMEVGRDQVKDQRNLGRSLLHEVGWAYAELPEGLGARAIAPLTGNEK